MTIDLKELGVFLPNANKDARRIALFGMACQKKALELVLSDPNELKNFTVAAGQLLYKWINAPKRWSIADLFRDPFKALREETRVFADRWMLDDVFRQEMG